MKESQNIILKELEKIKKQSGGHNGLNIVQLNRLTKIPLDEIRTKLNTLYREGKLTIHDTARGKSVKLK